MLDLPRSVRLATWTSAVLRSDATVEAAVTAVLGSDDEHRVDAPDAAGLVEDLPFLLAWALDHVAAARVVLPVPGHAIGLPGPPALNAAALDAGECVLLDLRDGTTVGLVPEVVTYGSWVEPGTAVTWRSFAAARRDVVDLASLSEAERALREAMATVTRELDGLDVARWRPDAADRIARVRDGGLDRRVVPPGLPPRGVRLLAAAARVRAIVDLASQDDGAAVNGWEASARAVALRSVDQVARRAMIAAVNHRE